MSDEGRDPPVPPAREMIEAELETVSDLLMRTVGSSLQQALLAGAARLALVGLPEPLALRAALEDVTGCALVAVHAVIRQAAPSHADELLSRQCSGVIKAAAGHDRGDDG